MNRCKTCHRWNTEPFDTQCDGVTPVAGIPQMGYCGVRNRNMQPEHACPAWQAWPSPVSVCLMCHRIIGPAHHPAGRYLPAGAIVSHGVCFTCIPAYCAECGLSQADTDQVVAASQPSTP